MSEPQAGYDNEENQADFHDSDGNLHVAADFDSVIVQPGEEKDQHDPKKLSELQLERPAVRSKRQRKRIKNAIKKR